MDHDLVRLSLVLGPADDTTHTYSYEMWRWEARCWMRDFVEDEQHGPPALWEGRPVMRALIVP